jgi:hypothetical protein
MREPGGDPMSWESVFRSSPPERAGGGGTGGLRRYGGPAFVWSLLLAGAFYARGEPDIALSLAVAALVLAGLVWITRPEQAPPRAGGRRGRAEGEPTLVLLTRDAALAHEAYAALQGRRIPCRLDQEESELAAATGPPLLRLVVPHEAEEEGRAALAGLLRAPPEPAPPRRRSLLRWRGFRTLSAVFVAAAILQSLLGTAWLIGQLLRAMWGEG